MSAVRSSITFPPEVYSRIQELAIDESRSFTKQVIFMLKEQLSSMGKYGRYMIGDVTTAKFKSVTFNNKFYEKVYIAQIGGQPLKSFHTAKYKAESYGHRVRNRYIKKLSLEVHDG